MEGRVRRNGLRVSPERSNVWMEPSPKHQMQRQQGGKVPVVYYLCKNRHLEHPHFIEVPLSSPSPTVSLLPPVAMDSHRLPRTVIDPKLKRPAALFPTLHQTAIPPAQSYSRQPLASDLQLFTPLVAASSPNQQPSPAISAAFTSTPGINNISINQNLDV
ncbi:hypothetical protein IEQ34_022072 [Dendrobium chrysotoxum]|uniref:SOSEKI DIX-like domain-containing protein n=1 Tax=Dendrobium chrysotoxum TaxID=161865 RepID=A0AAV7FWL7_DENCH|nr:hypothetical protein IEQ34_022072 [Dendrobium chrysotoxum]